MHIPGKENFVADATSRNPINDDNHENEEISYIKRIEVETDRYEDMKKLTEIIHTYSLEAKLKMFMPPCKKGGTTGFCRNEIFDV